MNKRTDAEVERRVNMVRMSDQIADIHEILTGDEGLCRRMKHAESQISWIKGIGTGIAAVLGYFIGNGK